MRGGDRGEVARGVRDRLTSRAPGAPKLAEKVRRENQNALRGTENGETQ